jgi:hypothetical protein
MRSTIKSEAEIKARYPKNYKKGRREENRVPINIHSPDWAP